MRVRCKHGVEVANGEEGLVERYKRFFRVVGDPAVVVSAILAVLFAIGSVRANDPVVEAALTVLLGIFAGITGRVWSKKYFEQEGHRTVKEKGKSATRSLGHIHEMITAIEGRLSHYLGDDPEVNRDEIEIGVEEALEKCRLTRRAILNSVEDWKDILPEADIAKQLGLVRELEAQISDLQDQLSQMEKERDEAQEESKEARHEREEKEKKLRETKKELREKERELRSGPLGSIRLETGHQGTIDDTPIAIGENFRTCIQCGRSYTPDGEDDALTITSKCPDCRGLGEGLDR